MILTHAQISALRDLTRVYDAQEADVTIVGPTDLGIASVDLWCDDLQAPVCHATITPGGLVREASKAA